jgi:hypothetical protein
MSTKGNWESEWKPGVRKENRSTKVQAQKKQDRSSINTKVPNLKPKKECKGTSVKGSA